MPKSRNRLSGTERAIRCANRHPANLPTGGNKMGKLITYPTTPVPQELRDKRASYNPKRAKPEVIWPGNRGTFRGSIRSTFTGARRNNKVAKAA